MFSQKEFNLVTITIIVKRRNGMTLGPEARQPSAVRFVIQKSYYKLCESKIQDGQYKSCEEIFEEYGDEGGSNSEGDGESVPNGNIE